VPQGLCTKADIPDGCGLIIRSNTGWRHTRKPTLQRVAFDMDTALRLINTRPHRTKRDSDEVGRSWAVDRAERTAINNALRAIGQRFGREVATVVAALARGEDLAADAKAKAETERAQARDDVHAVWDELAEAVGLPKGKSSWDIRHAVHATRDRLSKDDEVRALRQQMRTIELALSKARLPVDEAAA
jgi:hypothetical protein